MQLSEQDKHRINSFAYAMIQKVFSEFNPKSYPWHDCIEQVAVNTSKQLTDFILFEPVEKQKLAVEYAYSRAKAYAEGLIGY